MYKKNEIQLSSIRGLKEVKYGVKDKDKDIDKDKNIEKEQLEEGNNEEIKKEIVKEPPIKFSFITPNGKDIGMELSLSEKVNTIEFIDRMKKIKYSDLEIKNYWEAFKIQYFVGEKTYNSKIDIVSHFRNWLKDQKNGRQINSTSNKSNKPTTAELRNESLEKAFRL